MVYFILSFNAEKNGWSTCSPFVKIISKKTYSLHVTFNRHIERYFTQRYLSFVMFNEWKPWSGGYCSLLLMNFAKYKCQQKDAMWRAHVSPSTKDHRQYDKKRYDIKQKVLSLCWAAGNSTWIGLVPISFFQQR